jgi:hypothetical protein
MPFQSIRARHPRWIFAEFVRVDREQEIHPPLATLAGFRVRLAKPTRIPTHLGAGCRTQFPFVVLHRVPPTVWLPALDFFAQRRERDRVPIGKFHDPFGEQSAGDWHQTQERLRLIW